MPLLRPFAGLRPAPGYADQVAAPPYDVLNTEEARKRAEGRPWSFLHVSKPEIDLPEGIDPHDPSVYAKGAENLRKMMESGALVRDGQPCYYVYRLVMGDHEQTGLVAAASVDAYDANRIRKHELTRPDKEDDRVRLIDALNAQTGPVFLTYRHSREVDQIVNEAALASPEVDITADDGVRHLIWVVREGSQIERLTGLFDSMECIYIADGHHRSAAASRVAAQRRDANPGHTGDESYNYFLAVAFPDNQMQILDYNRVIRDLNGMTTEAFLKHLESDFAVEPENQAVRPEQTGEFGMYLDGRWYRLRIKPERVARDDPVASLDVSLLADHVIEPVLGIHDPRRDERIDFVGGIRGLAELERRVDCGEMAIAFSLYPTRIDQLIAVADAGRMMPPKSTWFEPKLADGLVSHVLDV